MGCCNLWECAHPGCTRTAQGVGAAFGLRAIGWYFVYGGPIYCPDHRPDGIDCDQEDGPKPCSQCKAAKEATKLQGLIVRHLKIKLPAWAKTFGEPPGFSDSFRKESKDHSDPTTPFTVGRG